MVEPLRNEVIQQLRVDQLSVVEVESPECEHDKLEGGKHKVRNKKKEKLDINQPVREEDQRISSIWLDGQLVGWLDGQTVGWMVGWRQPLCRKTLWDLNREPSVFQHIQ